MTTTTLNESDISLIGICLEIARDRFRDYAAEMEHTAFAAQFARQAADCERLMQAITAADHLTITTDIK